MSFLRNSFSCRLLGRTEKRFYLRGTTQMRLAKAGSLIVVAMCAAMFASRAEAAEPSSRDINSGWQFRLAEKAESAPPDADLRQWHAAQVPGVVQPVLLTNLLTPEPFARDNETRLQWI